MLSLVSLLLIVATANASNMEDAERVKFTAAKEYSCFIYQHTRSPKLIWDNTYTYKSKVHVLVRRNADGALVMQPSSYCEQETAREVDTCVTYWVRSVRFDDWFFGVGAIFVECPKKLNKEYVNKFIDSYHAGEYDLGRK